MAEEKRTVVVVGKTGSGKSSIANQITGQAQFTVKSDVASVTGKTACNKAAVKFNDKEFIVNMIDTVGLFDVNKSTGKSRDNDTIIRDVKKCINSYAPDGLNLVLFVIQEGRFTTEEESAISTIIEKFPHLLKPGLCALIITRCENKSTSARERIIKNFLTSSVTERFAKLMSRGLHTVGFPDLNDMEDDEIELARKKIEKDRLQLLELVADSKDKHLEAELKEESLWESFKQNCFIL